MDALSLAEVSAELLGTFFSGMLQGAGERTANELYSVVTRRMRGDADHDTLTALEDNPDSPTDRAAFGLALALRLAHDERFKDSVEEIIKRAADTGAAVHIGGTEVSATGRGAAAGRDVNQNRNYGGIVVGVVAVAVVLIVVFFVGKAVVVNLVGAIPGAGLSSSSTCRDYLSSSDSADKAGVMKKLYLQHNKPELAADPFIIQNTEYFCGKRPDTRLAQLAAARG